MGFVSKHTVRDLTLPNESKKILASIESDLFSDDNVLAFFYGGSIGNKNTDVFSDIDLRIVVKPNKLKEYVTNKKSRAKKWGNVLFFENLDSFSIYTIAHYDCFVKVDIFYFCPNDIQPSVWLKNIKIIKDTDGLMTNISRDSMNISYKPSIDEFDHWRTKFFAYLHESYRRTMRGEYYYALDCIDKLRLSIVTAWYMVSGIQPNTFGDWAKYEGAKSELKEWQKSLLKSWDCGRDTVEILNVMKSIVLEFKTLYRSLCDILEIEEDLEWVNKIVNMVL